MKRLMKYGIDFVLRGSSSIASFVGGLKYHEFSDYRRIFEDLPISVDRANGDEKIVFASYMLKKTIFSQSENEENRFPEKLEFRINILDAANKSALIEDVNSNKSYQVEFNNDFSNRSIERVID